MRYLQAAKVLGQTLGVGLYSHRSVLAIKPQIGGETIPTDRFDGQRSRSPMRLWLLWMRSGCLTNLWQLESNVKAGEARSHAPPEGKSRSPSGG